MSRLFVLPLYLSRQSPKSQWFSVSVFMFMCVFVLLVLLLCGCCIVYFVLHTNTHTHRRATDIKWKMYEFQWKFYEYFTLYVFPHFPPMLNSTNRPCFTIDKCVIQVYVFLISTFLAIVYRSVTCTQFTRSSGVMSSVYRNEFVFAQLCFLVCMVNCELYGKSMFHLNKTRRQMRERRKWGKWRK